MHTRVEYPFSTEMALLGFLQGGPRHGYSIYRELSEPGGLWLVWRMKQSQLYALLARLEDQDLLSSFKGEAESGRPPRKMYQLTSSGREVYQRWVKSPVERGRQFRMDLLIKFFFARREGRTVLELLLDAQRSACRSWLNDALSHQASESEAYRRLVHSYRAGQISAMLEWLDTCQDEFMHPSTTL